MLVVGCASAIAESVDFVLTEGQSLDIHTTLHHADSGCGHYADVWRVVDSAGTELHRRSLAHPHVAEQPFTRSLRGVSIAEATVEVFVEARDSVHGRSEDRVKVTLTISSGESYRVRR
jgi:hypothetical protein